MKTDLLVVGQHEGKFLKGTTLDKVNQKLSNELSRLLKKEEFKGGKADSKLLYTAGKLKTNYVLVLGLGDKKKFDLETARSNGAVAQAVASKIKARRVVFSYTPDNKVTKISRAEFYQAITEGFLLSQYKFTRYTKAQKSSLNSVLFHCASKEQRKVGSLLRKAKLQCEGVNLARDLINTPASDMTPLVLARTAKRLKGVRTRVHSLAAIRKLKMGAFLSVAEGSTKNPPCFIEMHYKPKTKPKKSIALIGKGVTFDTGGYSLKPPKSMETMKDDMSGAAAVIGLLSILPRLNSKVEVRAYIAATDNMVDGRAQCPGDVCKAMNGTTVEVLNTDAEGRLTMADALHYANKHKPDYMIDVATLTGACLVALGNRYSGIMGNDQGLMDKLVDSGNLAGEKLWQLPLADEYREDMKSPIADLKNSGAGYGGAITAGIFLESFVGKTKWAHIDIAGPSWTDKPLPYIPRGGTGVMVSTMVRFLEGF